MNSRKLIGIILVVAAIAALVWLIFVRQKTTDTVTFPVGQSAPPALPPMESPAAAQLATTSVEMANFEFKPKVINIKKGTTVTWTNRDTAKHNAESGDGRLPDFRGPLIDQGGTYAYTFNTAGTFEYLCDPHRTFMKGTAIVTE